MGTVVNLLCDKLRGQPLHASLIPVAPALINYSSTTVLVPELRNALQDTDFADISPLISATV